MLGGAAVPFVASITGRPTRTTDQIDGSRDPLSGVDDGSGNAPWDPLGGVDDLGGGDGSWDPLGGVDDFDAGSRPGASGLTQQEIPSTRTCSMATSTGSTPCRST